MSTDGFEGHRTMRDRRAVVTGLVGAGAMTLVGCGAQGRTATVRFKVIARARVNGAERVGESVMEIWFKSTPNSLSRMQLATKYKGEAVILDFGQRGAAYFLITDYVSILLSGFGVAPDRRSFDEAIPELKVLSGRISVPRDKLPKIAAFRDETTPSSVFEVDPQHFDRAFGPGVVFDGLDIEITDEPITRKIQDRLTWLEVGSTQRLQSSPPGKPMSSLGFGERIDHNWFLKR